MEHLLTHTGDEWFVDGEPYQLMADAVADLAGMGFTDAEIVGLLVSALKPDHLADVTAQEMAADAGLRATAPYLTAPLAASAVEAHVVFEDSLDGRADVEIDEHRIQIGGSDSDGYCHSHQSYECLATLTDDQVEAIAQADHDNGLER